ncbi:hypothetical protein ABEF95_000777 [Exophiala dermatitidis]
MSTHDRTTTGTTGTTGNTHNHSHTQHTHGAADSTSNANPSSDNTAPYATSDPTAHPDAKPTSKLVGDIKGAAHGVAGSLQAATGTMLRNDKMAEKGFEKMNDEDARLAAKSGKPPVGSETREETVPVSSTAGTTGPAGVTTANITTGSTRP